MAGTLDSGEGEPWVSSSSMGGVGGTVAGLLAEVGDGIWTFEMSISVI